MQTLDKLCFDKYIKHLQKQCFSEELVLFNVGSRSLFAPSFLDVLEFSELIFLGRQG